MKMNQDPLTLRDVTVLAYSRSDLKPPFPKGGNIQLFAKLVEHELGLV